MKSAVCAVLCSLLLLCVTTVFAAPLCLQGIRLLPLAPGKAGEIVHNALLCMEDGRILFAGPSGENSIPPGAEVLDLPGRTVTPGLVNAHMHHMAHEIGSQQLEDIRRSALQQGVTTLCDLAAPVATFPLLLATENAGGRPFPRTLFAGPALTAPGGYPAGRYGQSLAIPVNTPDQARQAVHNMYRQGARILKLAFESGDEKKPIPCWKWRLQRLPWRQPMTWA